MKLFGIDIGVMYFLEMAKTGHVLISSLVPVSLNTTIDLLRIFCMCLNVS